MRRILAFSLPLLLLASGVSLVATSASASNQLWACQSVVNDDGYCSGSVCAGNGGWGECAPQTTEKVCTSGHAPCAGLDVVCVYGPKINECVVGCACDPAASAPAMQQVACTDEINDAPCPGSVCAGTPSAPSPVCVKPLPETFCTSGHDDCTGSNFFCAMGTVTVCLLSCECIPLSAPGAQPQPCVDCPTYPIVCISNVTAGPCGDGDDVCLQVGMLPRDCQDLPSTTCSVPCQPHAECTVFVGSGAAAADCTVQGREVGPLQTCDTCAVLFGVTCQVGTEADGCDGVSPPPCACVPAYAPPVPVAICVQGVNAAHCYWNGQDHTACVTVSQQLPQCLPDLGAIFTCGDLAPVCANPTDPCSWGLVECAPCESQGACCGAGCPQSAPAAPPAPECMEVYWSEDFGPVGVTMQDSCHVTVEQHVLA